MSTRITLAAIDDEAELRDLMQKTVMPGMIRLSYGREPHFFHALSVLGAFNQIVVARNTAGCIVGSSIRSIKPMYINGVKQQIGYLSHLRLEKQYRGKLSLAKGFKYLNALHQDARCPFYLTTIMADNVGAQQVLAKGRKRVPHYHFWGKINTYLIGDVRKSTMSSSLRINFAQELDRKEILHFLYREGKQKQFFPDYTESDFNSDTGLLRDLNWSDILVAKQDGEIVATLALWNQNAFKQIMVQSYHPLLNVVRPAYNLYTKLSHHPRLISPGKPLDIYYAALVCVKNNETRFFQPLITRAANTVNKQRKAILALGLHENDGLNDAVTDMRYRLLRSNLYLVSFPSDKIDFTTLKNKIPYLELGAL